jgi:small multidrug resistance pump
MIKYPNFFKEYLNLFVTSGYVLLFVSAILTTYAYRIVPLKFGPIIESAGYIYILFLSYFFLKEKITKRKLLGNFVIAIGILVFSL